MRPFLCSLLKCSKCKSCSLPKLNPKSAVVVPPPAHSPNLTAFRESGNFIQDLADSLSQLNIVFGDGDIQAEMAAFQENDCKNTTVESLLYSVEIKEGEIVCSECGDRKEIGNGILYT